MTNHPTPPSMEEIRENRKSLVRVIVTYGAAGFLFIGGIVFIAIYIFKGEIDEANSVFLTILPVSASIISFWFAGRSPKPNTGNDDLKVGGGPDKDKTEG